MNRRLVGVALLAAAVLALSGCAPAPRSMPSGLTRRPATVFRSKA